MVHVPVDPRPESQVCCYLLAVAASRVWATAWTHNNNKIDRSLALSCIQFITTNTHPFNDPLSGLPGSAGKGKTNLDFTEARDSEWQWHQTGHMQVCTSLQTDNQTSTPPLSFLQAGCPSCLPTNSVKALKTITTNCTLFHQNVSSIYTCRRLVLPENSTEKNCARTYYKKCSVTRENCIYVLQCKFDYR